MAKRITINQQTYDTIDVAFKKYCNHLIVQNLSKKTIQSYKSDFNLFCKVIDNTLPVKNLDTSLIDEFIVYMMQNTNRKITSINSSLRSIRAFVYYCFDYYNLPRFKIKMVKNQESHKPPYTDEEIEKLLEMPQSDSWTDYRSWAIVNYLISTGNRASTVINIKISDIDFNDGYIKLAHTKNKQAHTIPICEALNKVLKKYLSLWEHTQDDYLFPSVEGTQLGIRGMQCSIQRYNNARGVTKTSLHLFRHTFARLYVLNGGDMAYLQQLLGHSTLDMTRKYIRLYSVDLKHDVELKNPLNNFLK